MDARRTLIADAALRVIAAEGSRGLTQLAIDREAGLPKGSTSYYCRRRVDVLRLALQRLYVLDLADLDALRERLAAESEQEAVVDAVAGLIVDWLTGDARTRTLARFELFLAGSRVPELQELLQEQLAGVVSVADAIGTKTGGTSATAAAALMLGEGLMLSVVRSGLPTPTLAEVRVPLAALLLHEGAARPGRR